jgi:hypothetical protein
MDCVPTPSAVVAKIATPPASVSAPSVALPFLNVTSPVGVPDADETPAVKLTDCPCLEGFGAADSEVVVATG